jgi:hypothetical protein
MGLKKLAGLPEAGDGLPPDAPRGKDAERILWGELLAEFRQHMQTSTAAIARLGGRLINDVLEVRSGTFPAAGYIDTGAYHVAAGCVVVDNYSQHDVVVVAGGAAGSAPSPTVGVTRVKSGCQRIVNLAARSYTFYGTAGDEISWQAFTSSAIPSGALSAVNGGGA